MKKICFITTISVTLKAFVIDTAKYLHEKGGYDITFICNQDEQFAKTLPNYINYIPVMMKRGISLSGIKATFQIFKILKKEKFDIVQYSTPNASLYASIAAKLAGIPIRLYCQWGIAYVGFHGVKRKIFKTIERLVCLCSTWIEPDSFGNLKFSHQEGLYTKEKSSVIWNGSASGINLTKFNIRNKDLWKEEIKRKYNIDNTTLVLGFIGRVTRDKGINELLWVTKKLFEENDDSVLMIIGDKEKTNTLNKDLVNWSIKEQRVIYCGRTNEVEKYFATMDIFILPSYREGFGSVVIEAEAMGVPVIVTDIPGPTDAMIKDKTGIVIKKADVSSLELAIRELMNDPIKRENMGKAGAEFATKKFESTKLFEHILFDRNRL